MGIGKRLQDLTADLKNPLDEIRESDRARTMQERAGQGTGVETRFPPAIPGVTQARTGPGQMLAFRSQMLAVEGEVERLRARLGEYEDSLPVRKINPATIHPSRWANRHSASYLTLQFISLKADIEHAGGNVQPILVKPVENNAGTYEIVFGHRRHQACKQLGLPVLAAVWTDPLPDSELFAAMDRENRERADLSPYEQGVMYQRALEENLYPSQRRLAESLGVSHTWVRKALTVAELPQPVVECFRSPLDIQHRHAEQIAAALEANRKGVLRRAEKIRSQNLNATDVVAHLIEPKEVIETRFPVEILSAGKVVGHWTRDKAGALVVKLNPDAVPQQRLDELLEAIVRALQ